MRQLCLLIVFIGLYSYAGAQTAATKPKFEPLPYIIDGKVSMYLKIPAEYQVVSCWLYFTDKKKGNVLSTTTQSDKLNGAAKDFLTRAVPGDLISFEQVKVLKDGKKTDWPGKVFIVQ